MVKRRRERAAVTDAINPRVLSAARDMSVRLADKGFAHVLIGGLAVRHHGYERTTSDVDFLVTGHAAVSITGDALGGEVRGKTLHTGGRRPVQVDLLFPDEGERFLEKEISKAARSAGNRTPVISREALVYLKLKAGRMKDNADIIELLKRGKLEPREVIPFLKKHRPEMVDEFESLMNVASLESD